MTSNKVRSHALTLSLALRARSINSSSIPPQILDKNDFAEKPASKMSQDVFMQLLADFNEHGIHFA